MRLPERPIRPDNDIVIDSVNDCMPTTSLRITIGADTATYRRETPGGPWTLAVLPVSIEICTREQPEPFDDGQ
jgi:hypothetical protein